MGQREEERLKRLRAMIEKKRRIVLIGKAHWIMNTGYNFAIDNVVDLIEDVIAGRTVLNDPAA